MDMRLFTLLVLVLLASFTLATTHAVVTPSTPVIGAYYPGDSAARYLIARIPADKLTHLFYAFAHIEDGKCVVAPEADAHFEETVSGTLSLTRK